VTSSIGAPGNLSAPPPGKNGGLWTTSKRLELLREVVSPFRRLAIMGNVSFAETMLEISNLQAATQLFGTKRRFGAILYDPHCKKGKSPPKCGCVSVARPNHRADNGHLVARVRTNR